MTQSIRTGEGSTDKTRSWELEVVGVLEPDGAKGYWTQSGVVLRIQDMKMLQKVYNDMTNPKTEEKSYEQVYVKVEDLKKFARDFYESLKKQKYRGGVELFGIPVVRHGITIDL